MQIENLKGMINMEPKGYPDRSASRPGAIVNIKHLSTERINKIVSGEDDLTDAETDHILICEECDERFRRAYERPLTEND